MRILMTTDTIGGVWTFTRELTEGLLAASHEVSLLSLGRHPNPEQSEWTRATLGRHPATFRYTASEAPLEWMNENERCWDETAEALSSCVRDFDPEILHGNQYVVGQYDSGLPTLITAHSDVLTWAEACQPEGLAPSPWLDRALKFTREGLAGADTCVAPSQWMAAAINRLYAHEPEPHVIPNGRDLVPPTATRRLQAVSVGRLWDPAKGLDLVASLQSPIPMVVAGATSLASSSAPPLPSHMEVLGQLSQTQLAELFSSSAIYIASSRYEPFGLAPLEAALCGCAVIARDIPSLREVWAEAALYFTDSSSLERLLRHLAADPQALAEAQSRSLAQARQYTRAAMTEAYLAAYDELLMRCGMPPYDYDAEPAHA